MFCVVVQGEVAGATKLETEIEVAGVVEVVSVMVFPVESVDEILLFSW